jgi:hypothetical protein
MMRGFNITDGQGFHVTFANGYTVSVQFGAGSYCANRRCHFEESQAAAARGCPDAEIAAWGASGTWYRRPDWDDDVKGWVSPDDVLAFMQEVAALPHPAEVH